jgi:hypothetical protein
MNSMQVQKVHQKQAKTDKTFGEIAIKLGYLNEQDLNRLLSAQKEAYLELSQALIDKNYLTITQLLNALDNYKKECQLTDEQMELLRQGDIDKIVHVLLEFKNSTQSTIFGDYISLFLKSLIRFVDENPYLERNIDTPYHQAKRMVSQELFGEMNLFTGIMANEDVFLNLASKYSGESFDMLTDELTEATIAEFLSIHNGIFLVNMSNQSIEMEMKLQNRHRSVLIDNSVGAFIVPIYLQVGKLELIISEKMPEIILKN